MSFGNALAIAGKEIRDALRQWWFWLYAGAFALLAIGLSAAAAIGSGRFALAAFERTTAGLVNLILLLVPLMGLTLGAGAIARPRERGTLAWLLAEPLSRGELLFGKYAGLVAALGGALCLGLGASALAIAARTGGGDAGAYLGAAALAVALAAAMLAVGHLVSVLAARGAVALAAGICLWLLLAFVTDLGLLASAVVWRLDPAVVFHVGIANPLEAFKLAVLHQLGTDAEVLGPVGVYGRESYGDELPAIALLSIGVWIVVPLACAWLVLARRDVV